MDEEGMKHVTPSGKVIRIWDNLIPAELQSKFFAYAQASRFSLGWADSSSEAGARYRYMHCTLTGGEADGAGIYPYVKTTKIYEHLNGYVLDMSVINLSVPSDVNFFHTHYGQNLVLLYYANPIWQSHWHGETLFCDDHSNEIELAIKYTTGRLVLFDASLPHSIRPQSAASDVYRFTYSMFFKKDKGTN